jgi:hypothetical protein
LSIRFNHGILFVMVVLAFIAGIPAGAQEQQPAAAKPSTPAAAQEPAAPAIIKTPQGIELVGTEDGVKLRRAKESYTSLTLEGSELRPEPPMSTDHEKNADFERELVRLQWRPSDPIDMYVIKPPQVEKPPVVLYLESFPSDLDHYRKNEFCKTLVKNGAAAVGFVSARTGYRAERPPFSKWFVSELPESLAVTVHDVQLILNYLETRGDLDMTRAGMFGQGSGGAIAILAAAVDPRLKAIDLLNPWGDWPDWLAECAHIPKEERDKYLKPEFLKPLETLEPVNYLPKLASRAIRIQFWDYEHRDTQKASAKLEAAAPATAKIAHYPNGKAMQEVASEGRLFEWIADALSPQKPQQAAKKMM